MLRNTCMDWLDFAASSKIRASIALATSFRITSNTVNRYMTRKRTNSNSKIIEYDINEDMERFRDDFSF